MIKEQRTNNDIQIITQKTIEEGQRKQWSKTQHRDTVNIGYTKHRIKTKQNTIQRYCQHWVHQTQDKDKKTQHRDTVNIGYTRHRTETNKTKTQHRNTQYWIQDTQQREILVTLDTQDTGGRQTKQKYTTERYW